MYACFDHGPMRLVDQRHIVRAMAHRAPPRSAELTAFDWIRRVPPWTIDLIVGTLLVVTAVLTTGSTATRPVPTEPRDAVAWVLMGAATLPLFVRRHAPVAVYMVSTTAVSTMMLAGYNEGALPSATIVALYTVGTACGPRALAASVAFAIGTLALLMVADLPRFGAAELVSTASVYGAAVLLGRATLERRRRIDAFADEQAEAARSAAAAERLRIAQELHDIVAHSLGLIAVQASAATRVFDKDPAEARRSLEHIAQASRASLSEIRWLVGALRDPADPDAYSPVPQLSDLPRLISEARAAGLSVDLSTEGDLESVPAGVALAGYRVTQEALTNTMRHAPGSHAVLRVEAGDQTLRIEATDDGGKRPLTPSPGGGHGLIGMRERVGVYCGTLQADQLPGGGFRVVATIPFDCGGT